MTEKRAILLVGSPRGLETSTSGRLGGMVCEALLGHGFATERIHIHAVVRAPEELEKALTAVASADLVVLSLPLYVDSFPAPVIALLERIAQRGAGSRHVQFAMIIQCGFPEREHNDTAIAIAKRFASEVGWHWLGALALGGSQTFGDAANEALGRVAEAIAAGRAIPPIAVRSVMPSWLYRIGGNIMWRRQATKQGLARPLRARPYEN